MVSTMRRKKSKKNKIVLSKVDKEGLTEIM